MNLFLGLAWLMHEHQLRARNLIARVTATAVPLVSFFYVLLTMSTAIRLERQEDFWWTSSSLLFVAAFGVLTVLVVGMQLVWDRARPSRLEAFLARGRTRGVQILTIASLCVSVAMALTVGALLQLGPHIAPPLLVFEIIAVVALLGEALFAALVWGSVGMSPRELRHKSSTRRA
jgi:hypothetical protein